MEKYKGQATNVDSNFILREDGYWTVTLTISNSRKMELNDDWETKKVSLKVIDTDRYKAYTQALIFMNEYLEKYDNDIFAIPEKEIKDLND